MYKILLFMKRRPELSVVDFRDYYEKHHAPLCRNGLAGVSKYVRRYVTALDHPETGGWTDCPFDVITELWFDKQSRRDQTAAYLSQTLMPPEIVKDEEYLFDRSSFRIAVVDECADDFASAE